MKKIWFGFLLLSFLIPASLFAGGNSDKEMLYFVDVCEFYDREGKPYLEIYLNVEGMTVHYGKQDNGSFMGSVQVMYEIRKKESPEEDAADYLREMELLSGEIPDTSAENLAFGFMDVRRISLEPGEYLFTGVLTDNNAPNKQTHKFVRELVLEPQSENLMSLSDIEFITAFKSTQAELPYSKHGYDIIPMITNSTFVNQDSMKFYFEVYNVDRESEPVYFANVFVTLANSTEKMGRYNKIFRQNSRSLDLITGSFDITALPSQTYYLNVDLYNKMNKVIGRTTKKFFVVNSRISTDVAANPQAFEREFGLSEAQLDEWIPTLRYASTVTEEEFAKRLRTFEEKKNFFYNFWEKRKKKSSDPISKAWGIHKARVNYTNQQFKAVHLPGWRTDRGRIYLTYGPPNNVDRFPSDNARYPYQVWSYNKVNTQANVIFVFFDPDGATDEWPLLHSNVFGGQNNPRWKYDIVRRSQGNSNMDNTDPVGEPFGW